MNRLKLLILLFAVATAVPMTYVVVRTYRGLAQEETSRMRFFAETLFDTMEASLANRIEIEENRPVDAYQAVDPSMVPGEGAPGRQALGPSPEAPYILGYLQNNPDGSFQTPQGAAGRPDAPETQAVLEQLAQINRQFNRKKTTIASPPMPSPAVRKKVVAPPKKEDKSTFADQFLDLSRRRSSDSYLGRKTQRTEEITAAQAQNVARQKRVAPPQEKQKTPYGSAVAEGSASMAGLPAATEADAPASAEDRGIAEAEVDGLTEELPARFQVEVAPLQSVMINAEKIFVFRRIVINERIYRQGFILEVGAFLSHLADRYFLTQPMADFAQLQLEVADAGQTATMVQTGAAVKQVNFVLARRFPAPFDFLLARLTSEHIPAAAARQTLNIMLAILAAVFLLGLGAIYRSARATVDLSERRARFVSSVTHELKTPLTNIRMYIEMLEQGIARDAAREQDYLRVVGAESARLSRLINNVLELSRLEKKQRPFDLRPGSFTEVLEEVRQVMEEKLRQEGFTLTMAPGEVPDFPYDREVMIQILINLIENSIKFGSQASPKEITITLALHDNHVAIRVADTGPGIPSKDLKKVFDDFYRVEGALTRTTGGTGIGLALVKKFVTAMGGSVAAANNNGPGCTITLRMPRN
jgi:signal transduction histidine kinase